MAERSLNPAADRQVLDFATPLDVDVLFWELHDSRKGASKDAVRGTPHPNPELWPNHKLVHVSAADSSGWQKWWYAADREHQDQYNWEIRNNDTLIRSYVIPRDQYPPVELENGEDARGRYQTPAVPTADETFPSYVFTGESVQRVDKELDAIYVVVQRIYSIARLISYQWDDAIQRSIKITREIVAAATVVGSQGTGYIVEIQPQDTFHDFKITSEVQWLPDDLNNGEPVFPIQLDSVAADVNFPFPPKIKSIKLFGAWAYAESGESAPDYAEDFFFEIDTIEPSQGPYDATVLRFLTDNPEAVRATYPTTRIHARQETFGLLKAWAMASNSGNRAFALARQYTTPVAIHGDLELPSIVNYTQGGGMTGTRVGRGSANLPATPGYAVFAASSTTIAGVKTVRSRFGLWEVQVTRINEGGSTIYIDNENRSEVAGTGSGYLPVPGGGEGGAHNVLREPAIFSSTNINPQLRILEEGGSNFFRVWSDENVLIEILADWISTVEGPEIEAPGMANGRTIAFTYSANSTGAIRSGVIRLTAMGSGFSTTVTVNQNPQ